MSEPSDKPPSKPAPAAPGSPPTPPTPIADAAKPEPKAEPYDPAAGAAALAAMEAELLGDDAPKAVAPTKPAAKPAAVAVDAPVASSKAAQAAEAKAAEPKAAEPKPAEAKPAPAPAKPPPKVVATEKPVAKAPAAHPYVVEFEHVTKQYGGFTAIKDVNFKIKDHPGRGEMVSILGPSGCGKSTVIRMIAGLSPQFPATTGTVLVGGKQVYGPGPDRGMVFQDYTSFDNRSVIDNIAFGLECRGVGKSERYDLARHWIAKVGLSIKKDQDKHPHELSGGMRQRVAIARTLILEPKIILMDEPFGALDPPTRSRMQDNLVELWREQSPTVFFITHSVEEACFLGDHILIFSGSPGTILEEVNSPPPTRPSLETQRDPEFLELVWHIRETIEKLESSVRAGD